MNARCLGNVARGKEIETNAISRYEVDIKKEMRITETVREIFDLHLNRLFDNE